MMARYAANTEVGIERTQLEIKSVLRRYGAERFVLAEEDKSASIGFTVRHLVVRLDIPLPSVAEFMETETGRARKRSVAEKVYEQACRQRWRALLLAIKAKLESVEVGLSTLETEFMPFIVMPDGQTLGSHLMPKLIEAAESGRLPKSILALPALPA